MKAFHSVKIALLAVAIVAIYFLLRSLFAGAPAEATAEAESRFAVLAETATPQEWRDEIIVRGRTAAERNVLVRAETAGAVAETPAPEGTLVMKGDVLCQIAVDARRAQLAEARAALAKARLDHQAAVELNREGFRAETGVAAAKAALDLAAANVERAEVELSKTKITAPFDGVFDQRHVEVGDFLKVGDPCGAVIQQSPFLVTGAVSEKDVAKIAIGDRGVAQLATGETIEGVVKFVAAAADPATRTFDVELEVPNEDGALRDGVTAEFTVFAKKRMAYRIPRSALTLDDNGAVGVRTLSPENAVGFAPLALLGEDAGGVWASGLEGEVQIITRGQDFVKTGQIVDVAALDMPASGAER